ncbi:MAG: hypothetical protein IPL55_07545 [Saprospiraceae bacterium]|nr:hypothetical protein [Saprospiraceae bacterium]
MDSVLGGSDNIFKYMATVGMLLIGIGVLYPLEKKNDLELKRNNLISELKTDSLHNTFVIERLEKASRRDQDDLEQAQNLKSKIHKLKPSSKRAKLEIKLIELLDQKEKQLEIFTKLYQDRQTNSIKLEFKGKEIELLREQSEKFGKYYKWCFFIGLPVAILGFILWFLQTIVEFIKKKKTE